MATSSASGVRPLDNHAAVAHGTAVDHRAALDRRSAGAQATLFHALADPTRLTILRHLATGEHRVRDLVEHLGLAQSTVSTHLSCLRDCGLVVSRTEGRASWFSLRAPEDLAALLDAGLALLPGAEPRVDLRSHLLRPHDPAVG